jgi:glutamine synthetase
MQNNTAQNTIDFLKHANYGEISSVISKIEKDFLQKHSLHRVTTGFEQEFYLSTSPSVEILDEISKIDGIFEVKKELGDNQFEITTIPQVGFVESCRIIQNFRVVAREICAKHKIEISFSATQSEILPPSSLQISVCLYETSANKILEFDSKALQQIVQNVTENIPASTLLVSQNENCFERTTNWNFVKIFKNSPTHATWGTENRTVALRIAKVPNKTGKRLEFRTPSSLANPYFVAIAFLISTLSTAEHFHEQTFIDSHTSNAKPLPNSQNEAEKLFTNSKIEQKLKHYFQKNGI